MSLVAGQRMKRELKEDEEGNGGVLRETAVAWSPEIQEEYGRSAPSFPKRGKLGAREGSQAGLRLMRQR